MYHLMIFYKCMHLSKQHPKPDMDIFIILESPLVAFFQSLPIP